MKSLLFTTAIAGFMAILFSCNNESKTESASTDSSTSTTTAKSDEWIPVDSATAMRTMMEVGTPGAEQAMLAKADGNWKAEVTMWMDPAAPPMKSTGTMTNKMILGGRYQQSNFKGDMMGMPFEGVGTVGYDKARKVWVSTWVDNMSTAIMTMEGTWDDATKTATYTGKMLCPGNGKMCEMKQTVRDIDDKTQVMEMYGPDMKTGKPYKNMEMKMTKS